MAAAPPTPPVPTVEPAQRGERRVLLEGAGDRNLFEIAYVAPAVRDADYRRFPAAAGDSRRGLRREFRARPTASRRRGRIRCWPSPQPGPRACRRGSRRPSSRISSRFPAARPRGAEPADTEAAVERAVAALRDREVTPATLAAAQARVLEELVFDVETTEDAAHELAFFAGLNALDRAAAIARERRRGDRR